jgi:hypothetical protein
MAELDWEASIYEDYWDSQLNEKYESLFQRVAESGASLSKIKIVEGTGQVNVQSWKPGEISLHVETPTGMKIYLSHFYYPYWTAHLTGESASLNLQPSEPDGLLSLSIPGGDHQVLLELERSKAELTGLVISLISIVITLSYIVAIKLE